MLSVAGLPASEVMFGTALSSAVSTLIVGLFANLPFALAPGLGLSAYFSYGLVIASGRTYQQVLVYCCIAGGVLLLLSVLRISERVIQILPDCIKFATLIGLGLLLAFIGLTEMKLIVAHPDTLVALGDLTNWHTW